MGTFVISTRANGEFQFKLAADDGQSLLTSEGYSSRAGCDNGVESVRRNSQDDARYDANTSSNGKFYFNLKATNGQVIGTSAMYGTEADRASVMASVKATAPGATIDDQTAS